MIVLDGACMIVLDGACMIVLDGAGMIVFDGANVIVFEPVTAYEFPNARATDHTHTCTQASFIVIIKYAQSTCTWILNPSAMR